MFNRKTRQIISINIFNNSSTNDKLSKLLDKNNPYLTLKILQCEYWRCTIMSMLKYIVQP